MNYDNGQIRGHGPRLPTNHEYHQQQRPIPSGYPAHALPGNVRYGYPTQQQQPPHMGFVQQPQMPPQGVNYPYPQPQQPYPGDNYSQQQQFYAPTQQQPPPPQVYYQQPPPQQQPHGYHRYPGQHQSSLTPAGLRPIQNQGFQTQPNSQPTPAPILHQPVQAVPQQHLQQGMPHCQGSQGIR